MSSLNKTKRVLLVSGSNYTSQVYDGLRELKERMNISLSILSDGSFEPDGQVFSEHFSTSLRETANALEYMKSLNLRFDAVVNKSSEWLTPLTALLAELYGCKGVSPRVAFLCRSKFHMRQAFLAGSLPTPRFRICKSFEEIRDTALEFNRLCVAKPIGGNASYGTFLIDPNEDLSLFRPMYEQAISFLRRKAIDDDMFAFSPGELSQMGISEDVHMVDDYLVEEFLAGTQVSIDSLTHNGRTTPIGIAQQVRMPPPFFLQTEEYMPFTGTERLVTELLTTNEHAISSLGVENGATHVEIIMTENGPRVLEIGCRIGGDNIHDALYQTTGVQMLQQLILLLLDEECDFVPNVLPTAHAHVAMKYFLPSRAGVVQAIDVPDELEEDPRVTELSVYCSIGSRVAPPPESYDFLGYIQVRGETKEEAKRALEEISSKIHFPLSI